MKVSDVIVPNYFNGGRVLQLKDKELHLYGKPLETDGIFYCTSCVCSSSKKDETINLKFEPILVLDLCKVTPIYLNFYVVEDHLYDITHKYDIEDLKAIKDMLKILEL